MDSTPPNPVIDPLREIQAGRTNLTRRLVSVILSLGSLTMVVILAVEVKLEWHPLYLLITGCFLTAIVATLVHLKGSSAELLEKEKEYRLLAENMSDVLFKQDMEMNLLFVNSAVRSMFGFSPDEAKTRKMADYLTPASLEKVMKNFRESVALAMQGAEVRIPLMELEYVRSDGSTFWGELRVAFIRDSQGRPSGSQGIVRDITERKIAEKAIVEAGEAAEKASRAKSDFITMMSHELRTPLTSILGFSELLYSHHSGGLAEEDLKICERINRNSRHLLNLINNILDLASIESGKVQIFSEKIDVRQLVGETVAMMSALVGGKPVEIVMEISPDLPELETDGVKLMQVIINVLGNAIKFTEEGRITIAARREPGPPEAVRISIADTGIGIPPDKVRKIFDKFEQAENVLTRKFGGAGLGLSISRTLMEMLGGTIAVSSRLGAGSTFMLTLPSRPEKRSALLAI